MRALPVTMLIPIAIAGACAPSRSYLFDPVLASVRERTGVTPEWRSDWRRSPAADARIRELLAEPLTSERAAAIAILSSAELQAAFAELELAGAAVTSARTAPNPEVEAELVFPLDDHETRIELTAVESLTDLLSMIPRSDRADAELRAARRRAVATTVDLAARARAAFYEAVAAEQTLSLRRTIAEAATASATLARSLHEAGNITDLALAREELFEEDAALAVRDAEARVAEAREELNATLGLHGDETAWRVSDRLPDPPATLGDLAALEREAVAASLDLEALRWRIQAAGHHVGVARLESALPDVGVGVAAKREGSWAVGPVLTLSLPIFDWGQGERAAAWAEVRRARHEYTAVAIDLRATARAARARATAAHERVTRMKQRVFPLRERLIDEGVRQYNAMNLDAFELLTIRREQIEAEERYIDALRAYWIAQTRIDQLRAGSLPARARREAPARAEAPEEVHP